MIVRDWCFSYCRVVQSKCPSFFFLVKNGVHVPQSAICRKTLTNESMKPSKVSEHFTTVHPEYVSKGIKYFKNKAEGLR